MSPTPAQRALAAASAAFVISIACLAMFLPPLAQHTLDSVLRTVAVALVLATALLLHCIFVGIAARRLGRSVAAWVALALLLYPVGSAAALILLTWLRDEAEAPAAA